jgi:hypothetical protein
LGPVWRDLKSRLGAFIDYKSENDHLLITPKGSSLECWSLDSDAAEKMRGRKYALLLLDEAAHVPKGGYVWESVMLATLADYNGRALLASTPRGRLNWFYELWGRGRGDGQNWAAWHAPSHTSPYANQAFIESQRKFMDALVFAQEWEAQFTMREGALFPNWRELVNVTHAAGYDPAYPVLWGVDVGYANPSCILLAQQRPLGAVPDAVVIFDELYLSHHQPAELFALLAGRPYAPPDYAAYDPAAAHFYGALADWRAVHDWPTVIRKAINAPAATEKLRRFIQNGAGVSTLFVHPRCENLIREIPDYHAKAPGSEQPAKLNDHAVDAARYLMTLIQEDAGWAA